MTHTQLQYQAALVLLNLHNGSCSIRSDTPIMEGFKQLDSEGKVTIQESSTSGYVDVYDVTVYPQMKK